MPILTRLSDTWACAASEPANTARPAVTYRAKGIMVSSWATWSDRQGIGHEPAGLLPEGALSRPRPHRTPRRQAQALQAHCAPLRENEQELRILRRIRFGPHHRQIRPHGLDADPVDVLRWFVRRWRVETTFEEARRHLGLETQRQWSDLAILRTTPALLGLFSLVTLWATQTEATQRLLPACVRWYPKH